jgi:hypothetical protein
LRIHGGCEALPLLQAQGDLRARVESLIADYTPRFMQDFMAVLPALDKPPQ